MTSRRRQRQSSPGPLVAMLIAIGCFLVVEHSAAGGLLIMMGVLGALGLVVRNASVRKKRLRTASDLARLRSLSPTEFEHVIATALNAAGWRLRVVGGSGDEGADLIGRDSEGRAALVQCKRFSEGQTVGSQAVQMVIGARTIHSTERALIVTTARFTEPARTLARRHGVELIDESTITGLAAPGLAASAKPPTPPQGWYPTPNGRPGVLRWWDGSSWSASERPAEAR